MWSNLEFEREREFDLTFVVTFVDTIGNSMEDSRGQDGGTRRYSSHTLSIVKTPASD